MKYRKIFIIIIILFVVVLGGCNTIEEPPVHSCTPSDWKYDDEYKCGDLAHQYKECIECGLWVEERDFKLEHNFEETRNQPASCTDLGIIQYTCTICGNVKSDVSPMLGHKYGRFIIDQSPTIGQPGIRHINCSNCGQVLFTQEEYVDNAFFAHGKLSVDGRDLVDKNHRPFQLYGLSTHGIQWFGSYVNFDTLASLQSNFGINVIRFAFYTDEDGYCDGSETKKQAMLDTLEKGIEYATRLGLYVIIDWHMVGAENPLDKNPLTYMVQAKEFFEYISKKYKSYGNVIYEIMNEPNGGTSWQECKNYAQTIIPIIRQNTNAIILVGNPNWTADLVSVMRDPLVGFENIMYTYHFYAADHRSTSQVEEAYDNGFPVFISEFGFMDSDGDGALNLTYGENWLKILDQRNISYVAWNISNSPGSASIFKYNSNNKTNMDDSNLKEWGVYLKKLYRKKSGLSI